VHGIIFSDRDPVENHFHWTTRLSRGFLSLFQVQAMEFSDSDPVENDISQLFFASSTEQYVNTFQSVLIMFAGLSLAICGAFNASTKNFMHLGYSLAIL